jgi:hypothetical protein
MAEHLRTELIIGALDMAIWNRWPARWAHPPLR